MIEPSAAIMSQAPKAKATATATREIGPSFITDREGRKPRSMHSVSDDAPAADPSLDHAMLRCSPPSAVVIRFDLARALKRRIDAGATYRGRRLFGDSKTWPNSFVKRQRGIAPGKTARGPGGRSFYVWD